MESGPSVGVSPWALAPRTRRPRRSRQAARRMVRGEFDAERGAKGTCRRLQGTIGCLLNVVCLVKKFPH